MKRLIFLMALLVFTLGAFAGEVAKNPPNFRMLYLMESLNIPESDIDAIGKELSDEIARAN
jgi:hypothetical protein